MGGGGRRQHPQRALCTDTSPEPTPAAGARAPAYSGLEMPRDPAEGKAGPRVSPAAGAKARWAGAGDAREDTAVQDSVRLCASGWFARGQTGAQRIRGAAGCTECAAAG